MKITQNEYDRRRAARDHREILPEPGTSFAFQTVPDEATAMAVCFADSRMPPDKDRTVFNAGWMAYRRVQATEEPIKSSSFTRQAALCRAGTRIDSFTRGWNGAVLWVNENVPTVEEAALRAAAVTFKPGDVLRDADNYLGTFRRYVDGHVTMTVRAGDTGADIPRRATLPVAIVASERPRCETCKHWYEAVGLTVDSKADSARGGVCGLIVDDSFAAMRAAQRIIRDGPMAGSASKECEAFTQNDGDASSRLRCKPTFGCVLHEPRLPRDTG